MLHVRNGSEVHDRVLAVLQENAASLLKIARLHSLCDDDAQDAYQRGLEIYLHRLESVDPATAGSWLRTVIKHEAMSIREQRARVLDRDEVDFDDLANPEISSGDDRAIAFDHVARAAEALRGCKRDEVAAMVLKADGHSYDEICAVTGWTYTKVNRCLVEGRSRFLKRYAAIESGAECDRLAPLLSLIVDGEATPVQMAEARPHLRNCPACRASLRELTEAQAAIHVVFPAAVLLGGAGVPGGAAGFFSRTYEMLVGGVHDRLAVTALKAQHAVETVSASKVAAVAASAAAVAGGGVMAVDRSRPASEDEPSKVRRVAARPAPVPTPAAADPVRVSRRAAATKPRPRVVRRARVAAVATATPAPVPRRSEFGFETKAAPAAVATAARKPRTEDFGFER